MNRLREVLTRERDRVEANGYMAWLDATLVSDLVGDGRDAANDLKVKWAMEERNEWKEGLDDRIPPGFPLANAYILLNGLGARGWRPQASTDRSMWVPDHEPDLLFARSSDDLPDNDLVEKMVPDA